MTTYAQKCRKEASGVRNRSLLHRARTTQENGIDQGTTPGDVPEPHELILRWCASMDRMKRSLGGLDLPPGRGKSIQKSHPTVGAGDKDPSTNVIRQRLPRLDRRIHFNSEPFMRDAILRGVCPAVDVSPDACSHPLPA
jgi:hypothetical protein